MHVDGFRFDLATTIARGVDGTFHQNSSFLDAVRQDPVLSKVKLIAEPWDIAEDGYRLGQFPSNWAEWNDRYRDTVRRFWKGDEGVRSTLATRITGSSDIFWARGRRPWASINFITAHDGFTLNDLVSYNGKHNEANGEGNRDGTDDNRSWNCGAEGPADDPAVLALRQRQQRNFLATLLLSQGVPMLLAGDEIGRTQHGNNNAYCQDSELTWIDWDAIDGELLDFTRRLIQLRSEHPVLHRRRWFQGRAIHGADVRDIEWYATDGTEMTDADWNRTQARSLGMFLRGEGQRGIDGEPVTDDTFFVVFNARPADLRFTMPDERIGRRWRLVMDTAGSRPFRRNGRILAAGQRFRVTGRSVVVLCRVD